MKGEVLYKNRRFPGAKRRLTCLRRWLCCIATATEEGECRGPES